MPVAIKCLEKKSVVYEASTPATKSSVWRLLEKIEFLCRCNFEQRAERFDEKVSAKTHMARSVVEVTKLHISKASLKTKRKKKRKGNDERAGNFYTTSAFCVDYAQLKRQKAR